MIKIQYYWLWWMITLNIFIFLWVNTSLYLHCWNKEWFFINFLFAHSKIIDSANGKFTITNMIILNEQISIWRNMVTNDSVLRSPALYYWIRCSNNFLNQSEFFCIETSVEQCLAHLCQSVQNVIIIFERRYINKGIFVDSNN